MSACIDLRSDIFQAASPTPNTSPPNRDAIPELRDEFRVLGAMLVFRTEELHEIGHSGDRR